MIAVVLSVTPSRLRGALTRWLLEIAPGVYVGHTSKRVRERLWERIIEDVSQGRALMVWSCRSEQGLDFRSHNHAWETVDLDGLTLMRRTVASRRRHRPEPGGSIHRSTEPTGGAVTTPTSNARKHRDYRTAVESRRSDAMDPDSPHAEPGKACRPSTDESEVNLTDSDPR